MEFLECGQGNLATIMVFCGIFTESIWAGRIGSGHQISLQYDFNQ